MALAQAKTDALAARLSALSTPESGAWGAEARKAAETRLQEMGLPIARDEYWKYTRPESLTAAQPTEAAVFEGDKDQIFSGLDRLKIVFVDGVFSEAESDDLSLEGLTIERLSDAMAKDIHWAKDVYGVLEARGQTPVQRPLAALNSAYATDGVVIHVTGVVVKPVSLVYRREKTDSDAILHHVIKLDEGADLTLLENGPAAARFNKVMEVELADRAGFHHVRTQGRDHERRAATHIFTRLGAESTFKSFTLTANGVLTRNEAIIEMTGDNAVAHVAGAALGDGDFHHDDTVFITHDAVHCESRQVYKKVLRNWAVGVFQGKILVQPDAQKTDGYQISQSLLLDDDSEFYAKPELEIYADDVACSHGSTTGAIDADALFYLRARGVPLPEAQDMLVLSFVAEAVEEIESETLRDEVVSRLEAWLRRRRERG